MADEITESNTPAADESDELSQTLAVLNAGGSKLNTDGTIADVNEAPDGEDEDAVVATPAAEAASTATPTPKDGDDEDDDAVAAPGTSEKPEANNFRINLKGATDGQRKRALVRLLKFEPGIDLDEAARRVGLAPTAGTLAAQTAAAASPDPINVLRDEIKALEQEEEEAATAEFDAPRSLKLGRQIRAKQLALAKLELKAESAAEVEQSQQADTHETAVQETWAAVAKDFPDAGTAGTPLYNALQEQIAKKYKTNPGFFDDPEWPTYLNATCTKKLGLLPKTAANAPAPASQTATNTPAASAPAAITPRKASTPAPPAPAPGGSGSNLAQAAAVPQSDDPDDYFDFLNRHGSKG